MSDEPGPSRSNTGARKPRSPVVIVLSLLAFVCLVVLGVYETIPVKEHKATALDPTAQAIHDMQTSLQQVLGQLKTVQQTVSSDQTETKRLSAQVNALSDKFEALQQSFTSAQPAPAPVVPIEPEPVRPKRGAR
jgi:septal ring factor EnvC (AmiA/AmiB activator)